jgi:hypothetical protein
MMNFRFWILDFGFEATSGVRAKLWDAGLGRLCFVNLKSKIQNPKSTAECCL